MNFALYGNIDGLERLGIIICPTEIFLLGSIMKLEKFIEEVLLTNLK